jgi:hypothetical protein
MGQTSLSFAFRDDFEIEVFCGPVLKSEYAAPYIIRNDQCFIIHSGEIIMSEGAHEGMGPLICALIGVIKCLIEDRMRLQHPQRYEESDRGIQHRGEALRLWLSVTLSLEELNSALMDIGGTRGGRRIYANSSYRETRTIIPASRRLGFPPDLPDLFDRTEEVITDQSKLLYRERPRHHHRLEE